MILSCTGHRPNKLGNEWNGVGPISEWLRVKVWSGLTRHKPEILIVGMALGFDMIAAEVGIAFKVPVWAYIPYREQALRWSSEQKERYTLILSKCSKIVVCSEHYHAGCMQWRNEEMVRDSTALLAAWDGSEGGTKNCYDYARMQEPRKTIYRIGPKFGKL